MEIDATALLTPRDAGRLLDNITTSAVIKLAERGVLPELRDSGGRRLFRRQDVLRLLASRRARNRRRSVVNAAAMERCV